MTDLQIEATAQQEDADFYFNESRDMVTVIKKMLEAGKCCTFYYQNLLYIVSGVLACVEHIDLFVCVLLLMR